MKVALFSCNIEEYVDFVQFSGALGAWPRIALLDPLLKVMALRPRLIHMCMCTTPTIDVRNRLVHFFSKKA